MDLTFTESMVEQVALAWVASLGWRVARCPDMTPNEAVIERRDARSTL